MLHSLILLTLTLACVAVAEPPAASAQGVSYPAADSPLPEQSLKKLGRKRSDRWDAAGLEVLYSDVRGALCLDSAGQGVYLQRYPESDLIVGIVPFEDDRGYASAEGPATYKSPDGLYYNYGAYADGLPVGRWTAIRIDTLLDVEQLCPDLFADIAATASGDRLEECFPSLATRRKIEVTTANFTGGELDGALATYTLTGRKRRVATFVAGGPIGEELIYGGNDSLELRISHTAAGSDTQTVASTPFRLVVETAEHMPAFPSDCPEPDYPTAGEQEIGTYNDCHTKAMLLHIYESIEYPMSARNLGLDGITVVSFIVEKDGALTGIRTIRHISASLDAEARRVVAGMPSWKPGYQDGEAVRVQFNLPIVFRLE